MDWLVHELQACQLLMTNMFLNDHELLMEQSKQLYFIEKMFCCRLFKISNYIVSSIRVLLSSPA